MRSRIRTSRRGVDRVEPPRAVGPHAWRTRCPAAPSGAATPPAARCRTRAGSTVDDVARRRSPSASSSRMRRRTGSPRTSNACISCRVGVAGVDGRVRSARGRRRVGVGAGGDRGPAPVVAARPHEALPFGLPSPRLPRLWSTAAAGGQVLGEADQRESQPTPTAPGPNWSQRSSSTCAMCSS